MADRRCFLALLLVTGPRVVFAQPWEPPAALKAEAEAFLVKWLELVEQERYSDAYADFTPRAKSSLSLARWTQRQQSARAQLGALKSRVARRFVWFENPNRAPLPGVYVFAEYDCSYEKVAKHFEVILLHRPADGEFGVMQHQNRVTDVELGIAKWLIAQ
jgi:Protein of unknown function (DUF4019)